MADSVFESVLLLSAYHQNDELKYSLSKIIELLRAAFIIINDIFFNNKYLPLLYSLALY